MREGDVVDMLRGTADAAFVVRPHHRVWLWNKPAEELFGFTSSGVGPPCEDVLRGTGPAGECVCCADCVVLEKCRLRRVTPAFDLEVNTVAGRRWVNVTTVLLQNGNGEAPVLHLARDVHHRHSIESLFRRFLSQLPGLTGESVESLLSATACPHHDLTSQELKVLKLLTVGRNTGSIAGDLHVSTNTVRNHVEHILQKLSVHSRTEAVARAIREKIV